MTQQTISNFYIPGHSKRIYARLQEVGIDHDAIFDDEHEDYSDNSEMSYGINDGSKNNPAYLKLNEYLEISKITNKEIQTFVKSCLSNHFKIGAPASLKISDFETKSNEDLEADSNEHRNAIDAVFYWRRFRYSTKSIAAKLSIPKEKVNQILSEYRSKVKQI